MKAFSFLALIFLISCSSDYEGFISEEISEPEETYFDRIFFDSSSTFNGYKLGDSLLETVITSDSLSNSVFYTSFINVSEDKINNIELEIHVEYKEEANELVSFIVAKYNHLFNYSKTDATFVTWSYIVKNNLPAEVILIYDESFKVITLNINYKSQR